MKINIMQQELAQLGNGAHALATQMLGSPDDAADAVHDAFAAALKRPGAYQPQKGTLKAWFMSIVRHRCIDLMRQRRPVDPNVELLEASDASPEELAEQSQSTHQLRGALNRLRPEQQEIIILRDYLDMSYTEIAQTLSIAAGTVMSRLHRARLALKQELTRE